MNRRSFRYFDIIGQPADIQVKWQIIYAGKMFGSRPENLANERTFENDLHFGPKEFDSLCFLLQKLVRREKPDASLACSDVSGCTTVKDCLKLVSDTLTP
jgi:hypothetical protein